MRQLTYVKKGVLEWREVPPPQLQAPDDVLVRPFVAARCDLDNVFLLHDRGLPLRLGAAVHFFDPLILDALGRPPFRGPFAFGHECVAEVVACGESIAQLREGQHVVVPFQISCGRCPKKCRQQSPEITHGERFSHVTTASRASRARRRCRR